MFADLDCKPIPLLLVAPDGRLARAIRVVDRFRRFESVRFRSLEKALEKGKNNPESVLLLECPFETLKQGTFPLSAGVPRSFASRFFVSVPDLPTRTVAEAELFRFALLQLGVTAVVSCSRELPALFRACLRRAPGIGATSSANLFQACWNTLPWKAVGTTENPQSR